ncbi:MAG TPA: GDSL-type esterase/lipase family protein [Planctomycetota bacterium]|nr:GDSL-type esterase/lipase family protein [Planctomycetota bacterium]
MHTRRSILALILPLCVALQTARGGEGGETVIFDMDTVRHKPIPFGKEKKPAGTVELVEGKVGKACKFTFAEGASGGFFVASVRATPQWDKAAGLSFWLKGDGSKNWGGIELIDGSDYALRYAAAFPLDSTEWRKIAIPWCDLIPELPKAKLAGTKDGYAPSGFGNLWLGKWWTWRDYPAHSFTIDQVALESDIAIDATDYTPAKGGGPKLLAKLKAKRPVTIVTMGDSLTDKRHWANRQIVWAEVFAAKLKETYGSEVKLVNVSRGGSQLTHGLLQMPPWLRDAPEPDLVTVWYGYNDWSDGMRGERFQETLAFAVDRIRRLTKGKSEVLLITTCPAFARWDEMDEMAGAVRIVAMKKRTGLADVAMAFKQAGGDEAARLKLFCSDKTHLGEPGHKLAAETALKAIAAE